MPAVQSLNYQQKFIHVRFFFFLFASTCVSKEVMFLSTFCEYCLRDIKCLSNDMNKTLTVGDTLTDLSSCVYVLEKNNKHGLQK